MYNQDRSANEEAVKFLAGFIGEGTELPLDHKQDSVRRVMHTGYVPNQEMHHVIGLDQLAPLLQGRSEGDRRLIVNALNARGCRTGHDMYNLVSLDDEMQHGYREERPTNAHTQLSNLGLESRLFEGQERKNNAALKNSLTELSTAQIIKDVVPVFCEVIGGPSIEVSRSLNPKVTSIEENKAIYQQELDLERKAELAAHERDLYDSRSNTKPGYSAGKLDMLLEDLTDIGTKLRRKR